ncbi:exodeoxyribonuclease V subunit gamma [Succinimonas sp.]|uniref:exodeoxyribonuclease V subunit gamma n=1 Tax=Succinimonas sp. TaxID=1936151 RepID=UPI00386520BD
MFTTYYSDSLETLARIGGVIMKNMRGSSDLFVNEVIVTQNRGMFTYVKQVMTEENSIFALTRNVRLWPFIWDLARDILPDFPEDAEHGEEFDVFSRDSLKWNLMGALSRWQEAGEGNGDNPGTANSDLQYLRDYLNRPGITEAERTLLVYDLAAALADVYDQYQVYRPEWINQWMGEKQDLTSWLQDAVKSVKGSPSSSDAAGLEKFKWEASLWKILEKNIKGVSEEDSGRELSRISRSRIISELKNLLSEKNLSSKEQDRIREAVSKRIPGRVFFYGISSVPPEILDILIALGRFTDVHFMFLNPCKEYWGDLRQVSKKEVRERINKIMSCRIRKLNKASSVKDILAAGNQASAGGAETNHPLGIILPLEEMPSEERKKREKFFKNLPVLADGDHAEAGSAVNSGNAGDADPEKQLDELDKTFRDSKNPLLLSFGRRGRDMLALLTEKTAAASESQQNNNSERPLIAEISAYEQDYRDSQASAANTSILEHIRRDIFTLKNSAVPGDDKSFGEKTEKPVKIRLIADTKNPTLTVTSCPTRLREVQVLYDRILALFDKEEAEEKGKDKDNEKDEELLPRDIIVMAPDISVYAPFIEGVFKGGNENLKARLSDNENPKARLSANENPKARLSGNENLKARLSANEKTASKNGELPIAICDRSMNDQNPVLAGVRTLLSISDPDTILSAHDVAALLNIEEIRRKFGLSEEDIPVIGNILSDNNAMLGLDSDDVARFRAGSGAAAGSAAAGGTDNADPGRLQGRLEDVTIKQGINRMILGSMMPCDGSDDKPWNADCEGDLVKDLGVFAEFLAKLRDLKKALTAMSRKAEQADSADPVTMNDWHAFIKNRILDVFFDLGERGTGIMNYLKRSFADAADSIDALREKPRLTLTLTLRFFDEILSGSDDGRSPFLRNAINFCTFVPMRSIPFKHVFMLGMNDGDFPANPAVPGFDLMREKPRAGDRNRPDDDRYMFLEAVLAAQQSLHISYLGISPGDGSERNPSIVVSELLDYVADSMIPMPTEENTGKDLKASSEKELSEEDLSKKMRKAITRTATLNPSDARNYDKDSPFYSYQEQWFFQRTGTDSVPRHAIGEGIYPAGRLEPQNGEITITASDLLKFIRDPEKYFLNRKLGMKEDYDKPAPASERFCFAFLEKGNLMQDAARLEAADPDDEKRRSFRDLLIRKGAFPAGNVGEYAWRDFEAKIAALKNVLAQMEPAHNADDEISMTVPDYSEVCIKLNNQIRNSAKAENSKETGNEANKDSPFVPGSRDWLPWEITVLDDEIEVKTEEADAKLPWRNLVEEYRKLSRGQEPANITVRITGISEVSNLLCRNVMLDPWHKQDDTKFLLMKLVNAAMYVISSGCPDLESRNFYAMAVKDTVAPDKDLVTPMTGVAAAKILRNTLKLYLLGQIAPLRFESKNDFGNGSDSTRRNFRKADTILFDDMKNENDRNFRRICQAFAKFMLPGKKAGTNTKGKAKK